MNVLDQRRALEAVALLKADRAPGAIRFRVAGVTFVPGYPENLHRLRPAAERAWDLGECLPAVLIRNPGNEYDSNAIEVHVPVMGDEAFVGHMPRDLAARCAPKMDTGDRFAAEVIGVAYDEHHPDKPGLDIRVWKVNPGQARQSGGAW